LFYVAKNAIGGKGLALNTVGKQMKNLKELTVILAAWLLIGKWFHKKHATGDGLLYLFLQPLL
jgi:hypothetical protein